MTPAADDPAYARAPAERQLPIAPAALQTSVLPTDGRGASASAADGAAADATYRKILWRLIPFLMASYVVAFLDRSNIGFGQLQTSRDLGFSDTIYGLGAGIFYVGYSVFEVPSNLLLARIGARATFGRIMILWGLVSMAFALMASPLHFFVLRFLLGAAEAGFFPGVLLFLTYWIPAARRARATAAFMSAMPLSGVIGGPLSGWVMSSSDGALGWHGWQWMFVVEGVPAVLLGCLALFLLTDRPAKARWLSPAEKAMIAVDLAAEASPARPAQRRAWSRVLRTRGMAALIVMAMALIAGIGGVSLWLPTILRQAAFTDLRAIGLASAVPYLVAVVVQQFVARRSDRTGERRVHAAICGLVAAVGWIAMPFAANPWLSLLLLTLAAAGSLGATGPFWSLPSATLPRETAAAGIAIVTTAGSIAAFAAPVAIGWASSRTGSLATGQFLYGGMFLLGAIALLAARHAFPTRSARAPDPA